MSKNTISSISSVLDHIDPFIIYEISARLQRNQNPSLVALKSIILILQVAIQWGRARASCRVYGSPEVERYA
jgi:hypothetical protein